MGTLLFSHTKISQGANLAAPKVIINEIISLDLQILRAYHPYVNSLLILILRIDWYIYSNNISLAATEGMVKYMKRSIERKRLAQSVHAKRRS
jgi:hypothetical protein